MNVTRQKGTKLSDSVESLGNDFNEIDIRQYNGISVTIITLS